MEKEIATTVTRIEAPAKSETIVKFAREIRVNYGGGKIEKAALKDSVEAARIMRKVLPDNSREHFVCLYLDSMNEIIGYAIVFTGTTDRCPVHPREIFQRAFLVGASGIVVGHNHPSGNPKPSTEDEEITRALREAGKLLGIPILDHIVVVGGSYYSFADNFKVF